MKKSNIKVHFPINEEKPFFKLFLLVIVLITIILMILRYIFTLIPQSLLDDNNLLATLVFGRDVDFRILRDWMINGLYGMYLPPPLSGYGFGHFYLYQWYFIFWPFYMIPIWLSYIVWDILRVSMTIYSSYLFYKITKDKKECFLFLIFCGIGYAVDMYYNNANWLILFLLVESYIQYNKERKWLAGILFTIATFKIYVIIFPFILIISKKIKLKELLYFIIPFGILIIPYLVYPNWLYQMFINWNYSFETNVHGLLKVINVVLKLFEPAQLMFVSFMVLILILNFNKNIIRTEKWKFRSLIIAIIGEFTLFTTYLIFLGIFSVS